MYLSEADIRRKREENYRREKEITEQLLRNLKGRWGAVLAGIIPGIQAAIDAGPRKKVACPINGHGDGKLTKKVLPDGRVLVKKSEPDFRIGKDFEDTGHCICTCDNTMANGFRVIMVYHSCTFMEAKQMVIDFLGGSLVADHVKKVERPEASPEEIAKADAKVRDRLKWMWEGTFDPKHPRSQPMRNWIESRGLPDCSDIQNVRFHPSLRYVDPKPVGDLGKFPAQVALLEDINGRPVTLHRTYLKRDGRGKADVPKARKQETHVSDRSPSGCAVRLDTFQFPVLGIGEGLESSYAARAMVRDLGIPMWSTLDAGLLRNVVLPDWAKVVIVFGDRDRGMAGQVSTYELVDRARIEGRRATGLLPPFAIPEDAKSIDWDDVVRVMGLEAAKRLPVFLQWKMKLRQVLREMGQPIEALERMAA